MKYSDYIPNRSVAKAGGILLIIIVIIAILFWVFSEFDDGGDVPDSEYKEGDGDVSNAFLNSELAGIVSNLYNALNNYSYGLTDSTRCEAYKQVLMLNNNQLKAVANSYKKSYKTTLRQAMSDTNRDGCAFWAVQHGDLLQKRLNELYIP